MGSSYSLELVKIQFSYCQKWEGVMRSSSPDNSRPQQLITAKIGNHQPRSNEAAPGAKISLLWRLSDVESSLYPSMSRSPQCPVCLDYSNYPVNSYSWVLLLVCKGPSRFRARVGQLSQVSENQNLRLSVWQWTLGSCGRLFTVVDEMEGRGQRCLQQETCNRYWF